MIKSNINWWGVLVYLEGIVIFSWIGMQLPNSIAKLNYNNLTYGVFASYMVSILLFIVFTIDVSLFKEKNKVKEK